MRVILLNARGDTEEARFLREGERITKGGLFQFPCHFARIEGRIRGFPPPVHGETARSSHQGPPVVDRSPVYGGKGILGMSPEFAPPGMDVRHVGVDPTAQAVHGDAINASDGRAGDLDHLFRHL